MPTRTTTKETASETTTYVVVVDAVNITTGKKSNGLPAVTRLLRGTKIEARPGDPRLAELLAQHAVVAEEGLTEDMKALAKRGNAKRPTVQGRGQADGHFRVTASGVAVSLGSADDPALNPAEEFLPVDAEAPDLTPVSE